MSVPTEQPGEPTPSESEPAERVWNVCVPVIANLTAASGKAAQAKLAAALRQAGFEPFADIDSFIAEQVLTAPFEAEEGTEPDQLPTPAPRRVRDND